MHRIYVLLLLIFTAYAYVYSSLYWFNLVLIPVGIVLFLMVIDLYKEIENLDFIITMSYFAFGYYIKITENSEQSEHLILWFYIYLFIIVLKRTRSN